MYFAHHSGSSSPKSGDLISLGQWQGSTPWQECNYSLPGNKREQGRGYHLRPFQGCHSNDLQTSQQAFPLEVSTIFQKHPGKPYLYHIDHWGTNIPNILKADEAFQRTQPADSGWWKHAANHGFHEHETLSSLFCCELSSLEAILCKTLCSG